MILSTPFNEWLSNKTEAILGISVQTDGSSWSLFFKQISIDLLKTVFAICIIFLSLVLTLVPLINALVPFLTSYVFAFQFLTYSQTRRKMGLNQSLGFIFNHPFECLGFGIVTGLGFSVPIFSLFFLPLSVIGGTLLFSRFNK
jgi:CysZ protein